MVTRQVRSSEQLLGNFVANRQIGVHSVGERYLVEQRNKVPRFATGLIVGTKNDTSNSIFFVSITPQFQSIQEFLAQQSPWTFISPLWNEPRVKFGFTPPITRFKPYRCSCLHARCSRALICDFTQATFFSTNFAPSSSRRARPGWWCSRPGNATNIVWRQIVHLQSRALQ